MVRVYPSKIKMQPFLYFFKTAFAFRKNSKILDWPIGIIAFLVRYDSFDRFFPSVLKLFIFFSSVFKDYKFTLKQRKTKNSNSGHRTRTSMISQSRH